MPTAENPVIQTPAKRTQNGPRSATQRAKDLEIIARLYLKGIYQTDIAEELGISVPTVKRDLAKVRHDWLESSLRDFDALKAEQLAKIDTIEAAAWEMWTRSCEVQVRTSEQDIKAARFPGCNIKTDRMIGTGDPRYLQTALQCVERRCKLLGLNAPEKYVNTDSQGNDVPVPKRIQDMSDEEIKARVKELQRQEVDSLTETEIRELVEDATRGRFTIGPA